MKLYYYPKTRFHQPILLTKTLNTYKSAYKEELLILDVSYLHAVSKPDFVQEVYRHILSSQPDRPLVPNLQVVKSLVQIWIYNTTVTYPVYPISAGLGSTLEVKRDNHRHWYVRVLGEGKGYKRSSKSALRKYSMQYSSNL